jgi:phage baseplate assembly protein W
MTLGGDVVGRGMAFPPRVGPDGKVAWSEGDANVREAIRIILSTYPGERLRLPSFGGGLDGFLFEPNIPATHHQIEERIRHALADWEPRIGLRSVQVQSDTDDAEAAVATVMYELVATQAIGQLSMPVGLGG